MAWSEFALRCFSLDESRVFKRGDLILEGIADVDDGKSRALQPEQASLPSDLTDEEWKLVEPLIPPGKRGGGKRTVIMREVVNGRCPYRKSNPGILMMQSAQDRSTENASGCLGGA